MPFVFSDEYSAEGFRTWYENDEEILNRQPHTSEQFFANDTTEEDNIVFVLNKDVLTRLGSLGAVDMPTPFRPFRGTEAKRMNFPYFVEGWHTVQEEARRLAQIIRNAQSGRPSEKAIDREVIRIYRRTDEIVKGMVDVAEFMRMSMLQNGMFLLQNADDYGANLIDLYNYDTDGTWNADHIELLTGNNAWSDITNSDPIADLIRYDNLMQLQGARLEAIMADRSTLDYLFKNANVKNYAPFVSGVGASYILTDADVEKIIESRLKHPVRIIVNNEQFRGWDNNLHPYMQTNRVVLIGRQYLGTTWNGPTFEEDSNLVNGGNGYDRQARLANGTVISEYFKKDPDEKVFRISRSVIPSFEGMKYVYNIYWIDSATQWTVTYNTNGGTGTTPNPQGVVKGQSMGFVAVGGLLTNSGKRFIKWNTAADGTGTDIDAKYVPAANVTAYAIYEA